MGTVLFYHLTRHSPAEVVQRLTLRTLETGGRVMLRGQDRAALDRLDQWLWLHPEDGFLPHGMEGGPQDADQPLLIGQGAAVNGAKVLMLMGGMSVDPQEAQAMDRVCLMFEDADPAQVQAARNEWRAVTAAGLVAEYWADASGRWEKKAESGAKG